MEIRRMNKWIGLILSLAIPQAVGLLGALATATSVSTWYRRIRKPSWNPPGKVFGPVWTILYLLMGTAAWLVWQSGQNGPQVQGERLVGSKEVKQQARSALAVYGIQLGFNLLWSLIFFGKRRIDWALIEIAALWVLILETMRRFFRLNPLAGALLVPYQLWTTFAGILNAVVWWMNR
jgi:tryptophan-rich sensory protein